MTFRVIESGFSSGYRGIEGREERVKEVSFSSIFTQLPASLFCKLAMSHSATDQEGRAEPAGRKGDSACHRMRLGLKRQNQETEGFNRRERL